MQRYHGADVLAKGVSKEEIEICFLLGNAAFNKYILAISVGAVFFGANTYIGNGPNFMVKLGGFAFLFKRAYRSPFGRLFLCFFLFFWFRC